MMRQEISGKGGVQDVRKASRRTEKRWMVLFVEIRRKKLTYNESSISN